VITRDDVPEISDLKSHLQQKFQIKDLGLLRYFLEIEVARYKKEISLSQQKYVLDMLSEACMLGCKTANTLIDPNLKLLLDQEELLEGQGRYRRLVSKLNSLTMTRPDIAFPASVVSQFMSASRTSHWDVVVRRIL